LSGAWRTICLAAAVLAGLSLTACRSTQDKAREVRAENAQVLAAAQQGIVVSKTNKDVKVLGTSLLHDQYGDAIVVEVKNESNKTLVNMPILIDLRDAKGKSVYSNDLPGLDTPLTHISLLRPGETFDWVNDQISPNGTPKTAKVKVGPAEGNAPANLPEIAVGPSKLENNPSGILAHGEVTNKSQIDQAKLVLYAVARSGGEVVGAGRGQLKNLKAGAKAGTYNIFFIGDPRSGDVTVTAPPSVLQ
jgi:hypothetical protein